MGRVKMLSKGRGKLYIIAFSAGLMCLLVYVRSLQCGFVNLDDAYYIEGNPLIKSLDGKALLKIFTEPHLAAWIPLTYVSFAIDYFFWGNNPVGYHLTNIMLHATNTMLVVLLADRLFKNGRGLKVDGKDVSAQGGYLYLAMLLLTGLLWGLHPMRVESVAWSSERKDVLNGLFTLASVFYYLRYVQKRALQSARGAAWCDYSISIFMFSLSLLSKQVSVVLPLMLLIIDWFPLVRIVKGRVVAILIEKLPYFVLSLMVTYITISLASNGNVMVAADTFPLYARFFVSGNAVFEYCRYLLYPVGIVPFFPIGDTISYSFMVKTAIVAAFTVYCVYVSRKLPFIGAIWLSFVLMLLPVLAFTQSAEDTLFASRYTYLASISPSIAAGTLLPIAYLTAEKMKQRAARILLPIVIVALIFGYAVLTLRLIKSWENSGTLWTRQIKILPLGRAYIYRGRYLYSIGDYRSALDDFTSAIISAQQFGRDDIFNIYVYHGETLQALGLHEEAVTDFTTAIKLSPYPEYYYLRGCALKSLGRIADAEDDFRRAGTHTGPIPWFPVKYK